MSGVPEDPALVEALQETLAAEHAAVAVHEVLGGLAGSDGGSPAALVRTGYERHLQRRDHLRSRVAELGGQPVPAAAGYRVPAPNRRPATLLRLARRTEQRAAEHYAALVSRSNGPDRRWAARQLVEVAEHLLDLGADASAYPGLRELE